MVSNKRSCFGHNAANLTKNGLLYLKTAISSFKLLNYKPPSFSYTAVSQNIKFASFDWLTKQFILIFNMPIFMTFSDSLGAALWSKLNSTPKNWVEFLQEGINYKILKNPNRSMDIFLG